MKLRKLEMLLEDVQGFENPDLTREQYVTPAVVAARLLFHAHMRGDIEGQRVLDLGCGTGVLTCGAALLGAAEATGIDIDPAALAIARENAVRLGVAADFIESDVRKTPLPPADTVVMNPPFGAQSRHADRPFLDAALRSAPVIWGIFNQGSRSFVESYTGKRAHIEEAVACSFPMKKTFSHHTRAVADIPVEILRLEADA